MMTRRILVALFGVVLAGCNSAKPSPNTEIIKVGGCTIRIVMPSNLPRPRAEIVDWVRRGAAAVSGYLGHFPVKHLVVTIEVGGFEPIGLGVTHGNSDIEIRLGHRVFPSDLTGDWEMTHEMFHLTFPTLDRRYLWMNEGLSDYLEPIARARVGQWTVADAWREFVEGFPQGLPEPGGPGLDDSHTRERIYWGGNIYWLLADVQIRVRTHNRQSVDDAIKAILKAGGDGAATWPLQHVLDVGDKATGTTVLKELYDQLGRAPGHVDLDELWRQLGVEYIAGHITFDDTAPWANIRAAITMLNREGRTPEDNL